MSELDPRSLWQDQPTDDLRVHPEKTGRAVVDYAVPTTRFGAPPRRSPLRAIGVAAALAATLVVSVGLALRPPAPVPTEQLVSMSTLFDGDGGALFEGFPVSVSREP